MAMTVELQELLTKGGWLVVVILLDLALGVVVSLKQGVFEWKKLSDVLGTYGPKVVGWIALELLNLMPDQFKIWGGFGSALGVGAYVLILTSAAGSIMGHIQIVGLNFGVRTDLTKAGLPPTDKYAE